LKRYRFGFEGWSNPGVVNQLPQEKLVDQHVFREMKMDLGKVLSGSRGDRGGYLPGL